MLSFQVSDDKGHNFLELLDNDSKPIEPSISKGGLQFKYFGHSNSLYTRAIREIVNHAPIGEYCFIFFSQEEFKCLYGLYPIKSRHYILYEYRCYNNYWNPRKNSIVHFTLFLEFNGNAFLFGESITQSNCEQAFSVSNFHFLLIFNFLFLFFFFLLLHVVCIFMYVVMKQLSQTTYMPYIINC